MDDEDKPQKVPAESVIVDANNFLALLHEVCKSKSSVDPAAPNPTSSECFQIMCNLAASVQQQQTKREQQLQNSPATPHLTSLNIKEKSKHDKGSPLRPIVAKLEHTQSEHSEDFDMGTGNNGMEAPLSAGHASSSTSSAFPVITPRNRRTYSGSGQAISQHTRERLRSMIVTKKHKQMLHSSCSTGSSSNISCASGTSPWVPPSNGTSSEINLVGSAGISANSMNATGTTPLSFSSFNRFEPYPQPANRVNNEHDLYTAADFQLRKVNSEPNLKMQIRARILNKGSSPHQGNHHHLHQPPHKKSVPHNSTFSAANSIHHENSLNSCASDTNCGLPTGSSCDISSTKALLDAIQQQQQQTQSQSSSSVLPSLSTHPSTTIIPHSTNTETAKQPSFQLSNASSVNTIVPSPSLPNLLMCTGFNGYNSRCSANQSFTNNDNDGGVGSASEFNMIYQRIVSYLSMPSLLRNQFQHPPSLSSFVPADNLFSQYTSSSAPDGVTRLATLNRSNTTQLPIGGYPSLLKQQLRDLVLRRKSLVQEEPEDDATMELFANRLTNITGANTSDVKLKTGIAYDPTMSRHQCVCAENKNHVEHGGRTESIWQRLVESGIADACNCIVAHRAPLDLLRLVHSTTYVTFFAHSPTMCLKLDPSELPLKNFVQLPCGGIGVDSDTYFNDSCTQSAIRSAVGLLVELCCQVAEGKVRNGFACIRPPGHHAEREQAMGFCFFNNVAIATRLLQQRFSSTYGRRVAIIDWDVHHGNGTQLCFESDPGVLYISLHRHDNGNFFPGTGSVTETGVGDGKGYSVNIPFSGDVMGDAEYLAAWRVIVLPLLDAFSPDFILVSAGFDAARGHSSALGGYNVSPQLFGHMTRTLMCHASGRVVLALEGGYEIASICDSAAECVKALCAESISDYSNLSSDTLEQVPNKSAQETIQKVIAVHKKQWPCLTGIQGISTSELHWQTVQKIIYRINTEL